MALINLTAQADRATVRNNLFYGDFGLQIACSAAKKAGINHAHWVDMAHVMTPDVWALLTSALIETSPQEDACHWEVIDSVGISQTISLMPISDQLSYVQLALSMEGMAREAYVAACTELARVLTRRQFDEIYLGCHKTLADFVEADLCDQGESKFINDLFGLNFFEFIDWDGYWLDWYGKQGYWDAYVIPGEHDSQSKEIGNSMTAVFKPFVTGSV